MSSIKNFCIIAHIDHGKSTLSDRIIEMTSNISEREMRPQILDSMDLERERGITIKLNAVRLKYQDIQLNLIDTPGHADFSYEVSRSLSACEGAILVIDATKGVQAQTVSNYFLAKKANLEIVVAINKIDIPSINLDDVKTQIRNKLGLDPEEAVYISAKTGLGVENLLKVVSRKIPDAPNCFHEPLKALIFDSYYDPFKGAIVFIRVFGGSLKKGSKIKFIQTGKISDVIELGIKTPKMENVDELSSGEVGWVNANIKNLKEIRVGDTITLVDFPCDQPFPGYSEVLPMVYSSFFALESEKQNLFKQAIEKISLSDGSFVYQYEPSAALGFGCRCGFLGLLHLEIIKERLFREHSISVIVTNPTVKYEVVLTSGDSMFLTSPSDLPDLSKIKAIKEPYVLASISVSKEFIGKIIELMEKYRAQYVDLNYLSEDQAVLKYEIPLSEIIQDFYDAIKTLTHGYGSMDYELLDYRESKLVKVDILLNGVIAPLFSFITDSSQAYRKGKNLVEKLKECISPHLFEISIQAAINNKVISRENIKALRKHVTAKCYGGDITRKKKLWERQKEGKKKMKQIGKVTLPPDIFEKILRN
ncbi:GTP-binding protein LepA [Mycoplasma haemocanis str. Illinois]|uniref:Elongation factor 4 n=1 Tax=Mycoplasma haemocanis (strain Illinois) TaxID=1111676 RepID=H6N8M9_MYCHN|nr:translation elongation factor 4 [Mycoplasma haemocanis]AEW46001.1 GTP-binding protein LepA [Mycoplasma haemocanis str. Illinois]